MLRINVVENYAKRLHKKFKLELPVDLKAIASKYADLKFVQIPFDIDGVSANLKVSGKKPIILVNDKKSPKRKRFTLAHEIGHVIIPWHTGTIFDMTSESVPDGAIDYWTMENEANAFATELLMPSEWVSSLIENNSDIAKIHRLISKNADVSFIAACLRLISLLPQGYIFVATNLDSEVKYSGRSIGTISTYPSKSTVVDLTIDYPSASNIYKVTTNTMLYYWVEIPIEIELPDNENREWRIILDEIFGDIEQSDKVKTKLKCQLNGVFGFANGAVKQGKYTRESLYSACIQKFSKKEHLYEITKHNLFSEYLTSKICEIFERNESSI
ncbi:MAG: Zn-dependent peptidase ImmA (M78 family) [Oceanospirillaceae bacterium]|jgi:Zn-dependent peptidase ImmA (M78 family)